MIVKFPWQEAEESALTKVTQEGAFRSAIAEAGTLLREKREASGLTLRELADQTRITTAVLEAIERGWSERLPEPAYLASMLPILEKNLDIKAGSLNKILIEGGYKYLNKSEKSSTQFTLGNINIFTTWQGSILYLLIMFISLLILNNQQQNLLSQNIQTINPIPPNLDFGDGNFDQNSNETMSLNLRPIENSLRQSSRKRINRLLDAIEEPQKLGVLEITLTEPRDLVLSSNGGVKKNLEGVKGLMTLQLIPPLNLKITPPPRSNDKIIWNGKTLLYIKNKPGIYQVGKNTQDNLVEDNERP